jgi:hypothetical protein
MYHCRRLRILEFGILGDIIVLTIYSGFNLMRGEFKLR